MPLSKAQASLSLLPLPAGTSRDPLETPSVAML